MKNSLIVVGILALQLIFTVNTSLASVEPYINEVQSLEGEMNRLNICSTRKLYATNLLKNLNNAEETIKLTIASN